MNRIRRVAATALAGGMFLATTACGGDEQSPTTQASAPGDQMAAFRACLEKQGVQMPTGRTRPSGAPGNGAPPSGAPANGTPPSGAPADGTRPTGAPPTGTPPTGEPRAGARPSDEPRTGGRPAIRPSMSAEQQKAMKACASLAPARQGY